MFTVPVAMTFAVRAHATMSADGFYVVCNQLVELTAIEPHAPAIRAIVDLDRAALGHQKVSRLANGTFHRVAPQEGKTSNAQPGVARVDIIVAPLVRIKQ